MTAHLGLLAFHSKLNSEQRAGKNIKHPTRSCFSDHAFAEMNSDWLTAVTSPMLQREKNTFLNAGIQPRDQCVTRRKEGTFQEPQNKLSTSFMTTEILASCAGIQLCWDGVTTVGLDLLLISNDY